MMGESPVELMPASVPVRPAAACELPTIVLKLAYDGTGFSGFAAQPQPGVRTVAGELVRALETFLRRPVDITCAGRTDAGVHALSQYVSFPAASPDEFSITCRRWMRAMSALLPDDIALSAVYHAAPGFSARFEARARTYTYRIVPGEVRPLLTRRYVWWNRASLDVPAMEEASHCLVGEHDFKSFCKAASAVGKPTHRCVMSVGFSRERHLGEECLAFTITGNAFLHSMVRTIVGSLVEVGSGHRDPAWLAEALAARDRAAAGPTAPAQGLCFMRVSYDEGALAPVP